WGGARSRRGGVPTVLADELSASPRPATRQLALPLEGEVGPPAGHEPGEGGGRRRVVLPEVVHVPGWLSLDAQRDLVQAFRLWALPPAGLRHPRMPTGHLMSVQSVCLGWHWQPYAYTRTADDTDGGPVKP